MHKKCDKYCNPFLITVVTATRCNNFIQNVEHVARPVLLIIVFLYRASEEELHTNLEEEKGASTLLKNDKGSDDVTEVNLHTELDIENGTSLYINQNTCYEVTLHTELDKQKGMLLMRLNHLSYSMYNPTQMQYHFR